MVADDHKLAFFTFLRLISPRHASWSDEKQECLFLRFCSPFALWHDGGYNRSIDGRLPCVAMAQLLMI
jgi:hypothetical protein